MNARAYIRDKKRTLSATQWAEGPIPKKHFPLFKDKSPISHLWRWRSAVLKSETHEYRLLVQLRADKPNYKAWLAVKLGEDWAMIGRLESHGHAGLHCHLQCPDKGIEVGVIDPVESVTIPHWKEYHRRPNKVLSDKAAWECALGFFRAQAGEVGLLGI